MSVLVRMKMPESCKKCKSTLCLWINDDCDVDNTIAAVQDFRKKNNDGFPDFCPIICQLPEGHGRLVDADELKGWFIGQIDYYNGFDGALCSTMASAYEAVCELLDSEDTIVPAERSET